MPGPNSLFARLTRNLEEADVKVLRENIARYIKDNPGFSPGADAEIPILKARLSQQVVDLRSALPSKAKVGGNMGVAEIDIPDMPKTMAASSRLQNPSVSQQNLGFVGEGPETFKSGFALTNQGVKLHRAVDSEAKILNNLAAKLGDNTKVKGTINLFTERPPCSSCSNVIQQFQKKYPNIKLNVYHNDGSIIHPTKK